VSYAPRMLPPEGPQGPEPPAAEPSREAPQVPPASATSAHEPPATEHLPGGPRVYLPGAMPPPRPDVWPALGYWIARSRPVAPAPPVWAKTYELPSARQVVASGLQLAVASNAAIRRASIYVGLLALGAFGPSVILILIGVGRLMNDPRTAESLTTDPALMFWEQPDLLLPIMLIYLLVVLGLILLVAISIDAQAMAISLLAGTASDRPLRLREAIIRARQTFWRLAGAGSVVGFVSLVVTFLVALPFLRPLDTNQGVTFIASMIGTLVVTPFAFASAGIVLGDVGATESLRRSVSLFKARPRIALVVTLFTLVTSAIQTFAVGAGADVAIRVAEFLHLGLDQGGASAILTGFLVLAFVVAFGSLTVTIAAIVSAPQVAGFLGLTFYAGGLDRARAVDSAQPRRFRWVTLPMAASMVGVALIGLLAMPTITGFEPRVASPLLSVLRTTASVEGAFLSPFGEPAAVADPAGDHGAGASSAGDILAADLAYLPTVPDWLLATVFDCAAPAVACGDPDGGSNAFSSGAYLFAQRMGGEPRRVPEAGHSEWGPVLYLTGYETAPKVAGSRFSEANHLIATHLDGEALSVRFYLFEAGDWVEYGTAARSAWRGDVLLTLVPYDTIETDPARWDAYASVGDGTPGLDDVREAGGLMHRIEFVPYIQILDTDFLAP
jgi:hypothetical protein